MNVVRSKRFLFLVLIAVLLVAGAVFLGYRYLPLNRIFKVRSVDETGFVQDPRANTWPSSTLLFDFEVAPGTPIPGNLSDKQAHSGKLSAKAFGKNSYSISFERTAGEIGIDNLRSVSVSAWIYLYPGQNEPLASLVFAASNKKINIVWKGVSVNGKEVPRGKWFKISGFFDLSGVGFKPDSRLEIYFWNNSDNDFLVDDLFIAFSGPAERPGDSTLVDLTRGAYTPRFNYPPFPYEFLESREIGNAQSGFLVMNGTIHFGDLNPFHTILTGPFITAERGMDDLLVFDNREKFEIYSFCTEKNEFNRLDPVLPVQVKNMLPGSRIITGSFSTPGKRQLLIIGKSGLLLGNFQTLDKKCSDNGAQVKFSVVNQADKNPFSDADTILTGDFLGVTTDQLLVLKRDGSWSLHRYLKENTEVFSLIAQGTGPIPGWNSANYERRLTSGRFLQNQTSDLILTVYRDIFHGKKGYALLRYNSGSKSFLPVTPGGRIVGLDTLQTNDEILSCPALSIGNTCFLWYSHDKGFKLKRIAFSDTTYSILSNVDFHGYRQDFNPKYFEILRIVSGRLLEKNQITHLVIGKNRQPDDPKKGPGRDFTDRKDLPNTIQVYQFKDKTGK